MVNRWKSIWESKNPKRVNLDKSEFEIFCELKRADGFDVNVGNEEDYYMSFYKEWEKMHQKMDSLADGITSIYEVGCGSGVNLFLFQNRIKESVSLGGIDYSASLINIAKGIINSDDLKCGDAKDLDETKKYDLVMADSVFQYFEGMEYAETILRKMLSKADKLVYIGELHDSDMQKEWLENRRRSMENYDEIYKDLPKMFYSRDWVCNIAAEYNKKTYFTMVDNKEYWNSAYVFNCYIY